MNGLVLKILRRLAALWAGLLSFALLFVFAPVVLGSHDGPIIAVDAFSDLSEDHDGDHHFKTLTAALNSRFVDDYTVISVAAGRYPGDIELTHEGLEIRSSAGPLQTAIEGHVTISARNVVISGFSIESSQPQRAVLQIAEDGVVIENSRISGAKHGVEILGVHSARLMNNQIYDHDDVAVLISNSWNVEITGNEIRGNGWSALTIEESHDLVVEQNRFSLNTFGGVWVSETQRARIQNNEFDNNGIVGLSLNGTSEILISENRLMANDAGIVLIRSTANEVLNNTISDGQAGGLVLKNNSQGNMIRGNTIRGVQGRGAIGIRLAGDVKGNEFIENRVIENGAGLVLTENETGSPMSNLFQENEIVFSDSAGIDIDQYAEFNQFVGNDIHHNLEDGVVSSGLFDIYENNNIFDNGLAGLSLSGARNFRIEGNAIHGNGAQGISISDASGALIQSNELLDNQVDGITIEQSEQMRLIDNFVARNGSLGISLRDVQRISLLKNSIHRNRSVGLFVDGGLDIVVEENEVLANANGGVRLEDVKNADVEANHFESNLRYGFYVMESEEVSALRNYWGDPSGPAGGFAGSGDAALGVEMDELSPWLPAPPNELLLRSVSGDLLQTADGQRVIFDASDRLGMIVELHNPGLNGDPGLNPAGLVVGAKLAEKPEIAPELDGAFGFYSLNVDGINSGTADLTILYEDMGLEAVLGDLSLSIFVLNNGQWDELPGAHYSDLQRVTGQLPVGSLHGAVLGVGISERPQRVINTAPVENEVEFEPPADHSSEDQSRIDQEQALAVVGSSNSGDGPTSGFPLTTNDWVIILAVGFTLVLLSFGLVFSFLSTRERKPEPVIADDKREEELVPIKKKPAHVFRSWPL